MPTTTTESGPQSALCLRNVSIVRQVPAATQTHPACCDDPACDLPYIDHLRGFGVSAHATPNRRPDVVRIDNTEAGWASDHPAYRRLHKAGIEPPRIDGSAAFEARL